MSDGNVLIVEDELIIAREMEFRLKELGCSVIGIAETGPQALQVLEIATPDLVLMDIGFEGASRRRRHGRGNRPTVVGSSSLCDRG
jgi:CheY-like chemotaxis protein